MNADDLNALQDAYARRYREVLSPLAARLESHLKELLTGCPRVDSVRARAKAVDRFLGKAHKRDENKLKYEDPLNQIQDQVAARIVAFYTDDVQRISNDVVRRYFRAIEDRAVVPDSPKEFDYTGQHFVLFIPDEVLDHGISKSERPMFFELQVKTLFQHAWAEAEHDLGYKAQSELTRDQRRSIAFTAAQAWGADHIFQGLAAELRVFERADVGSSGAG